MKFSTRVKLVSAAVLLVIMLAGSAWGATLGIKVVPTWNSSNPKNLKLEFTFYKDEKVYSGGFDILDTTERTQLVDDTSVRVNIRKKDGTSIFTSDENAGKYDANKTSFSKTESYTNGGVTADFTLNKDLIPGEYFITYRTVWDNDEDPADPTTTLFNNPPFDTLKANFEGYEGVPANGGQLVSIGLAVPDEGADAINSAGSIKTSLEAVTDSGNARASVIASEPGIDSATVVGLPVFKATVAPTSTYNYRRVVTLNDIAAKGYKVGDLAVVKIKPDGTTVKFNKVAPGDVGNGQFSVATYSTAQLTDGDAIQAGIEYIVSIGIADGGIYDWDTNPGSIIDPAGIGAETGGGSGGGGCNVGGYGVIALLLAAVGLVTRKSRKA